MTALIMSLATSVLTAEKSATINMTVAALQLAGDVPLRAGGFRLYGICAFMIN